MGIRSRRQARQEQEAGAGGRCDQEQTAVSTQETSQPLIVSAVCSCLLPPDSWRLLLPPASLLTAALLLPPAPAACSCRLLLPPVLTHPRRARRNSSADASRLSTSRCLRRTLQCISDVRPVCSRAGMRVPKRPSPTPDQSRQRFRFHAK